MEKYRYRGHKEIYGIFGEQLKTRELEIVQHEKILITNEDFPEGNDCIGFADSEEHTIYVSSLLSQEQKVITLFHELTHINFPGMTEEEIDEFSLGLFNNLTPRQRAFFELYIELEPESPSQ